MNPQASRSLRERSIAAFIEPGGVYCERAQPVGTGDGRRGRCILFIGLF